MTTKRVREIGIFLTTVGGAFLALYAIKNELPAASTPFHSLLLLGGAALTILGLAFVLAPIDLLIRLGSNIVQEPPRTTRRAKGHELERLRAYCVEAFGEDVSELNLMREWQRTNKDVFWIVEQTRATRSGRQTDLVGYYCVIPISKHAAQLVERGLLNGTSILPEHIIGRGGRHRRRRPAAVYIGGIAATGFRAKGHVLGALQSRLQQEGDAGARIAYSRPVTERGLDLLEKYGFTSVDPQAAGQLRRVYSRELDVES